MKLSEIKPNPDNPRVIKDASFEKLCNSIKEFPKMMALRPMVVDSENMVLGGNMRLHALQHLGFKEVPDEWVKKASDLTTNEQRRFIIADNVSGGEWDWSDLQDNWDAEELNDWGLNMPNWAEGHEANKMTDVDVEDLLSEEFDTIGIKSDKFKLGIYFDSKEDCEIFISKYNLNVNKKGQIWTTEINTQSI